MKYFYLVNDLIIGELAKLAKLILLKYEINI